MFKKAAYIDSAFRHIRSFSVVFLVGCATVSGFALFKAFQVTESSQQRVFILDRGKLIEAFAADRMDNIDVEARDHVSVFHHDFFTLDPDEKVIKAHLTKALYLADGSAKKQYDNLKEEGYYNNLIAGNISQELIIDSVVIDSHQYPYHFTCIAKEKLIRSSSLVTRNLVTTGYLRNVARSDNNPHGLLIEKWVILENKDVRTEAR